MPLPGRATAEGTRAFAARSGLPQSSFRTAFSDLTLSSIGQGTYLGNPDAPTDALYEEATGLCLAGGVNVLDTAIVYRAMRGERSVGRALRKAVDAGVVRREEVVVASKGGYIPFDAESGLTPRDWFKRELLDAGVLSASEIAGGSHSLAPRFLRDMVRRSLANLDLAHVDLYYLHNPESQLEDTERKVFHSRMRDAFLALEEEVSAGRVGVYGTATWNGYRVPAASGEHLDFAELLEIAEQVGGKDHHFRAVQLPFNLAMLEALGERNQRGGRTPLEAARAEGLTVMCSASILQSKLAHGLSPELSSVLGMKTDAQRAIQFVRSTPGVTVSLVGMKSRAHVDENLAVLRAPPVPQEVLFQMFQDG